MSGGLQAVMFDMDGLLVDTEPVWYEVECAVMGRLGGPWTPADQAALLGGSMDRTVAYLLARAERPAPPAAVEGWLVDGVADRLRTGIAVRAGACDLLDGLAAAGVPTALVSSSYRVLVDLVLAAVGRHRFAASVAGDEVHRPKPHPEGYLRAAAVLGVDPGHCVVLEDSDNGAAAGVAAGYPTVCVPSVAPVPAGRGRVLRESLVGITAEWLATVPGAVRVPVPPAA
jgi:HAD superfamily hydrolase (TIGR01509 family)